MNTDFRIEPLSISNWDKFEELFGLRGACANCWCMHFRLSPAEFENGKKSDRNKSAMKKLVSVGNPAGLIGFMGDKPVAWCAFAPRQDFAKLARSRIHKPIDNQPVWSVPCTFVTKEYRNKGISILMLKSLIEYAKNNGIKIIEAYPTIPTAGKLPDAFAWIGLYSSFEKAGFKIVDQTSKNRPMVRFYCG
jgi:GNAT superfamily N-acetyltransferase